MTVLLATPLADPNQLVAGWEGWSPVVKTPPQTPPHKGEGLEPPHRHAPIEADRAPQVFSPLVGEMAGRPEGDFLATGCGASLWWLGQAGFLIAQGGLRIVIDPYLSDSLAEKYRGKTFPHIRMMPPPVLPGDLHDIDWLLCTHGHTDHMDPGTIPALLAANPQARVLAPRAEEARALERGVPADRLVLIDAGETVDLGGVLCTATPSAHEDLRRNEHGHLFLGYVLSGGGVTLWHSGDTIPYDGLSERLATFDVDLALLPVNGRDAFRAANGVPDNLTLEEAVALSDAIGARAMLGHHFGLFDFNTLDVDEGRRRLARLSPRAEVALVGANLAYRLQPKAAAHTISRTG